MDDQARGSDGGSGEGSDRRGEFEGPLSAGPRGQLSCVIRDSRARRSASSTESWSSAA